MLKTQNSVEQIVLVDDFLFFTFFLCLFLQKSLNLMFFVVCLSLIVRQNCTFQLKQLLYLFWLFFLCVQNSKKYWKKKVKFLKQEEQRKKNNDVNTEKWLYASVSVSRSLNLDLLISISQSSSVPGPKALVRLNR